jgi:hypothetical protein
VFVSDFCKKLLPGHTVGTAAKECGAPPPTISYQQPEAAETACHVMSAKKSDELLQRLISFISMRIAWSDHLTDRALRLAGWKKSNVRKRKTKKKNRINPAFACCA